MMIVIIQPTRVISPVFDPSGNDRSVHSTAGGTHLPLTE